MLRCPCSCANINLEENPGNEVVPIHSFFSRFIAVSLRLFVRLRWGFHQKSYNFIQKTSIKLVTISFLKIYSDAKFGHHLWRHNSSHTAKTLSFERYGRKSPGNRPPWNVFLVTRKVFLNLAHCMELPRLLPTTLNFLDKRRQLRKHTLSSSTDCNKKHNSKQTRAVSGRMKFVV